MGSAHTLAPDFVRGTKGMWRKYVEYLMKTHPDKTFKELISNYDKKEYAAFKKNPKQFV